MAAEARLEVSELGVFGEGAGDGVHASILIGCPTSIAYAGTMRAANAPDAKQKENRSSPVSRGLDPLTAPEHSEESGTLTPSKRRAR